MIAHAQTPRDFAVDLKAAVSTNTPCVTLSWSQRQQSYITAQKLYRRLKNATGAAWELQSTLATNDTSFIDGTALPGVEYEYWMQRTLSLSPSTAAGYLSAGVNVPMADARGTLLLVVDSTMASPLAPEIEQLKSDLAGDGWTVQTLTATRTDTAANVKAQIKSAYNADPANVKMVYLLGHVPVPYSGNIAPDGHGDHVGAWPADGYYGDMDGLWTDTSVSNVTASSTRNDNIPGDGKFDQSNLPSAEELMVGRVDLQGMTRAPSSAVSETTLLRRYLRKAHDFRHKLGAYAALPRRSILRDGFGYFGGEAFAIAGWSWMFTGVGSTIDEPGSGLWFSASYAGGKDYLLGYGNGGGSYESASSVGNTIDFGLRTSRVAFTSLFGSYFGDWDSGNNFLRAPLAGNATGDSLGLCCFWGGRPNRFMHHMGMGETAGYSTMLSQNAAFWGSNYQPNSYAGVHCGLMGDPALRLHAVEPPRNLAASSANTKVVLTWTASTETNLQGYIVYRGSATAGPFTRLNETPQPATAYTDTVVSAGQSYTYLVRTLKLETSPGGSYFNPSVGSPVTITASASATAAPRNPGTLAVSPGSATNAVLTWVDTAADETSFRIERKTNAGGTYTSVGTASANATNFTDSGLFTQGNVYYYRVFAVNAAGDSAASTEASFEALAGYFDVPSTRIKVNKAAGAASVSVTRFGGATGSATVNFATGNSSAYAGTHYSATNGTLTWADGESGTKTILVPVINTAAPQPAVQFTVTLSSPSSGTGLTVNNKADVLIEDTTATLPAPWSQAIIGSVTDYSLAVATGGVFASTVIGGTGVASGSTSEGGQFIYQARSGDGILTAYVPSGLPSDGNARCALMIRDSTGSGGLMAAAVASSSSSFGTKLVYRTSSGGSASASPAGANTLLQPCWLRLTRSGAVFTAEASTDGSTWTLLGSATIPGMPASALWGIFHDSTDWSISSLGNYHLALAQTVTLADLPLPAAPTGLTATATSPTSIRLVWNSVAGASGYRIERHSESNDFAQIADIAATAGTQQTNIDVNVASDTAYTYRVYAYNTSGSGGPSAVAYAATLLPDVVTTLTTGDAGGGDATVQRDLSGTPLGTGSVATVAGYYYYDGVVWQTLTNAAKTYLRFNLAGLNTISAAKLKLSFADARYFELYGYYSIGAYLLSETSDTWAENSITWANAPQNNTSYYYFTGTVISLGSLYDEVLPTAGQVVTMDLDPATLFNNRGANNLVTIALSQYYGASIDWAAHEHGSYAPPTLEFTAANPIPARPSFLSAAQGWVFSVQLQWLDNAATETGFEIERSTNGGAFAWLQTVSSNTVAYTDSSTLPGVTYSYRVRAVNASGVSSWSSVATLATPDFFHASGTLWDAGGSDTLFSTAGNWNRDENPPFDGTAYLNFSAAGTIATINTNVSVRGLSIHSDADFALGNGGGTLTLGADGLRAADPNSLTGRTYSVAADVVLAANQTWGITNNGLGTSTLVVSGAISDGAAAYGLTKLGDGVLTLAGNSTYDGATLVTSGGVLRVTSDNALGSTNGNTTVSNGAWIEISGNANTPEPLVLNGDAGPASNGTLRATAGTNAWSGAISQGLRSRIAAKSGSRLSLTGGITGPALYLVPETNAAIEVYGQGLRVGSGTVSAYGQGTVAFGATNNTWSTLEIGGATVRTDTTNTLPATTILSMGTAAALDAKLDLNGNDQTVAQFKRGLTTTGNRLVTSATQAVLTVNQTSSTYYYDGLFGGAAGLTKGGAGTLYLMGLNSWNTGPFRVNAGTLVANSVGALGLSTNITVAGGTLKLMNGSCISDAATLSIGSNGVVNLNSAFVETVGALVVNGSRKGKGTWGSSSSGAENIDSHFTGTGTIYVPTGTSTAWDGGGVTADFSAPMNWDYDSLPPFDGTALLQFGIGGALATVNTNASLYGAVLNRDGDFTLGSGSGTLTLGAGGLYASLPGDAPHIYTVSAALALATNQTWCVTNAGAAATSVLVSGPISDGGAASGLTKTGDGLLTLAGDNAYSGATLVATGSILRVTHAHGLGSLAGSTTVQSGGRLEVSGSVNIAEPLQLSGDTSGPTGAVYSAGGTNTWSGTIGQSAISRIGATGNSLFYLTGAITGPGLYLSPEAGSCLSLAGQPLKLGSGSVYAHGNGTVAFGAAGNTWSTLEIADAVVRLDITNALPASSIVSMGSPTVLTATLDLNGNDQTVAQLKRSNTSSGNRLVTSARPAVLTLNQPSSTVYYNGQLSGALGLTKAGAGTFYLLGANSTYTGATLVSGGTLYASAANCLGNSTSVTVAGGTLRLTYDTCISDDATLAIANGAKVNVNAGLTETVRTLRLGGVLMRRGTYGATNSGADYIDDAHFLGTGKINVLRGTESVISIR